MRRSGSTPLWLLGVAFLGPFGCQAPPLEPAPVELRRVRVEVPGEGIWELREATLLEERGDERQELAYLTDACQPRRRTPLLGIRELRLGVRGETIPGELPGSSRLPIEVVYQAGASRTVWREVGLGSKRLFLRGRDPDLDLWVRVRLSFGARVVVEALLPLLLLGQGLLRAANSRRTSRRIGNSILGRER